MGQGSRVADGNALKFDVDYGQEDVYISPVKVDICTGLQMPFFPMRPIKGRRLDRPVNIKDLWHDAIDQGHWVMQPKLGGDRVCLACVDGKVYVQNRHGGCYRMKVGNAKDFLQLPNRTCFDGEVFKGNFYPFELLACNGRSLLKTVVHERVRLAKDLVGFLGHPWLFDTPTLPWLMRRAANRPAYEGVVLKQTGSPYILLGSDTQSSSKWMKRLWA